MTRNTSLVLLVARLIIVVSLGAHFQLLHADEIKSAALVAENETTRDEFVALLSPYVGNWLGLNIHEGTNGERYRFHYELHWFDKDRTVLEMTISQRYDDGSSALMWKGFKGWDPVRENWYYNGFSVRGQVARGQVQPASDRFFVDTIYRGFGPSANNDIEIRDRFTHVRNGAFESLTEIRRDNEWMEVNREQWVVQPVESSR